MEIYWVVQKIELKMCSDEIFFKTCSGCTVETNEKTYLLWNIVSTNGVWIESHSLSKYSLYSIRLAIRRLFKRQSGNFIWPIFAQRSAYSRRIHYSHLIGLYAYTHELWTEA